MKEKGISAVILAGGGSTRMGRNKALLQLGEKTMIEIVVDTLRPVFDEIILVTNHPEEYSKLKDILFVKDKMITKEKNSLVGIYTGLAIAKNPYTFVVPCDMPFIDQDLIDYMTRQLEDEDVIIPFVEGHYQPLHAIYGKRCKDPIKKMLEAEQYKIINFFHEVSVKTIDDETVKKFSKDMKCFLNINTYDAYLKVRQQWK
ncbi:molybdenum cofactor guanylyltransferase [Clostridium formicaceticum]|uniref:Probable molybdenum cofactor guanylyltransferase n=1 Tax=Clostridium formicaceticum TaxID=1497 RepID=A0AAC9RJ14_9CLOT|nr:molybdenum cofactor guanylyltransferase [Clostridium formicaceticum]AOY76043.1 molybdenum cofactor guanylyltransferase [Clostridium formicaceticum]ARE86402.1 putative molybdenum cofactor guanylyltransferase [Clostridium formicaceticum]